MTSLLSIGTLVCIMVCASISHATKLVLEFDEVDCKGKHHYLLECHKDFATASPQKIVDTYADIAYTLNDVQTSYNLARYMYTQLRSGVAVTNNEEALLGIVGEAARLGYPPAQVTYGRYLQSSQVGDPTRALHYFLEAHNRGDVKGALYAGQIYYDWGWYKAAFPLLEKAAHDGERDAQYAAGIMLAQGLRDVSGGLWSYLGSFVDVGKPARMRADRPQAITWLTKAHAQGHPLAKEGLLGLFESDAREGKASFEELMALGDACDISKTSLYDSKNRWDAIGYYQKAARLAAQLDDFEREGEARYQAGVILNKPYIEGEGAHFQWIRLREHAHAHFMWAAALGHERAKWCLEVLEEELCLEPSVAENGPAFEVQEMCGFFPHGFHPVKALEAVGGYPLPMGPLPSIR